MKIAGIQWDNGNWPKCSKHGVSKLEIEYALQNIRFRTRDPNVTEERYRAVSQTTDHRHVFVVYTHREQDAEIYLRPISARYMHEKEIKAYEQAEKMANLAK